MKLFRIVECRGWLWKREEEEEEEEEERRDLL
jgi:hypothetical protein